MTDYKETFLQKSNEWLDQPNKMFPKDLLHPPTSPLMVVDRTYHNVGTWFKPTTLEELLSLLKEFSGEDCEKGGGCKIVVGNTEVGIETKFKHSVFPRLISPSQSITSIFAVMECESCLSIGSCVLLSTIQDKCAELVKNNNKYGLDRIAKPINDMLRWFASTQIRNVACLGGNLATASPISDMNLMLACMNASLIIASIGSEGAISQRTVPVSEFYLQYRTVDLKPHSLVEVIEIPKPKPVFEYIFPYKQARRREDDISIVTSGMRILLFPAKDAYTIGEVNLAFGGMAPKTILAPETSSYLVGKLV